MGHIAESNRPHRSRGARRVVFVFTLVVVGLVVPLAVASHSGALGIPRSDDWSYLLTLFRWVDTGRLSFNGWVSMTLIGQLMIAAPVVAVVGRSVWAVQVFSAFVGLGGLFALVALGQRSLRGRRGAGFLALTIACGPLWAPLVTTYMTDVPAFAVQMTSLALAAVAFGRRPLSLPWLAASLAVGFLGVSIRQYGMVPVIAILLVALWSTASNGDSYRFRIVLGLAAIVTVATIALLVWWTTLPDALTVAAKVPTRGSVFSTAVEGIGFLRLTGLLLIPVLVLVGPRRRFRAAWAASPILTAVLAGGSAMALLVTYARDRSVPFVGNYVDRLGVLGDDVIGGHRAPVMPARMFDVLALVGSIGGVVLAVTCVPALKRGAERWKAHDFRNRDPIVGVLGLSVIGFALAYGAAILTALPIFDRYALPAVPLVGLLVLVAAHDPVTVDSAPVVRRGIRGWIVPGVAVAALGIVSLGFATDSASFDATRWRVAEAATQHGYRPLQVYGGFEWLAFHRHRGPVLGATVAERQQLLKVYFRHLCVTVAVDPTIRPDVRPIASAKMTGLFHGPIPIVAYRNDRPCR